MAKQRPGLTDPTGHSNVVTDDTLSENQTVQVTNIATELTTNTRDELVGVINELPLSTQGTSYVNSFNGLTGDVEGVSRFNGTTGDVVYNTIDGGEI